MGDDWVYVTAGGSRWHQRDDCEALAQGQQEATYRGMTNHPIRRVPPAQVGDRVACGRCVRPAVPVARVIDPALQQLRTDTEYERLFRDNVLGSLSELWDWDIESQKSVTVAARTYRVDFALTCGPDRIAIEVDGEHKGNNAPTHDEWTRRQTALASDGWEVLRFTNRQVRDEQEACRRDLAVTVARLRERRRHMATAQPATQPEPAPAKPVPLGPAPAKPISVEVAPKRAPEAFQHGTGDSSRLWMAAVLVLLVIGVVVWIAIDRQEDAEVAPGGGLDPRFTFCSEAKAAGYGPYVGGVDDEYSWYEDSDEDGVVCES